VIPGRNDPCPCGSGRKYKRCHGASAIVPHDEAAPGAREAMAAQQLDHDLVDRMMQFCSRQFGQEWFDNAIEAYVDFEGIDPDAPHIDQSELQLAMPWAYHSVPWGRMGESLAELFVRDQGRKLPPDSRALVDAQMHAWLSFWRIDAVERGVGLRLHDLLTQEERFVHERMGSQQAEPGLVIFGRVVDFGAISFIAGMHPHVLSFVDASPLVERVKRSCRVRTRPVPLKSLRDPELQGWMIGEWRRLVHARLLPPTITNTDGDPWESTVDHLMFARTDRAEVIARLALLEGAEGPEVEGDETVFVITRASSARGGARSKARSNLRSKPTERTVIGQVNVAADRMRIDTNSTRRGDALRKAVLSLTAPLVRFRLREATNTEHRMQQAQDSADRGLPRPPRRVPAADELEIIREYKRRHYEAWLDDRIPALGGKTPRAAVRAAKSRALLEALLADMEQSESRLPEAERFDVGWIREQLGL